MTVYRCRICGTPLFEGVLAPGTEIRARCHRRGCAGYNRPVLVKAEKDLTPATDETLNTVRVHGDVH